MPKTMGFSGRAQNSSHGETVFQAGSFAYPLDPGARR